MSHQRTLIRNALAALLKGTDPYATVAQDRVSTNDPEPVETCPAIKIKDDPEEADPRDMQGQTYIRRQIFKIELFVEETEGYDEKLDDFCKQVEDLIKANQSISGAAQAAVYLGTEPEFDNSGEKPVAKAVLTYSVQYIY